MMIKLIPVWKEAPFLRLLIPFTGGILLQWTMDVPVLVYWLSILVCATLLALFFSFRSFTRFRFYTMAGFLLQLLLLAAGGSVMWYKDIRHGAEWLGNSDQRGAMWIVRLEEPLHKKAASYKALASVEGLVKHRRFTKSSGKIVVYFAGDRPPTNLSYNSRIAFLQPLQPISNLGNPGGFDYKQYCAFQQVYHQVYLQRGGYKLLPAAKTTDLAGVLFLWQEKIVATLRTFVDLRYAGLAEALLIGYKDDLDKDLVQSYANTGVVHIIAISGMHLGLIYWLLTRLCGWINRRFQWLKFGSVIGALWMFALLTGGSPSVMRSALMFTFVAARGLANKTASVFNSLAASAFLLLCYNPCWLWDAGFQLSYGAVLGIVLFMRPVYNLFYIKNKLLDAVFKMLSTSLAAQVLTLPVSIYLFHQFPVYFLLTNLVTVPLSSLVVLAEIGVCLIAWVPPLAQVGGAAVSRMIAWMNGFVVHMERLPFSNWSGLQVSLLQTMLLYAITGLISTWLWHKRPRLLSIATGLFLVFVVLRTSQFLHARQQQLIVYNIPKHSAIQLISRRQACLIADAALLQNNTLISANIKPSEILHRFSRSRVVASDSIAMQGFWFAGKRILFCNGFQATVQPQKKVLIDIIIVSGNRPLQPEAMLRLFRCKLVVLDSTIPLWKKAKWKEGCKTAGVPCYPVSEKGAFVFQAD